LASALVEKTSPLVSTTKAANTLFVAFRTSHAGLYHPAPSASCELLQCGPRDP
jgi:hypothetical protein